MSIEIRNENEPAWAPSLRVLFGITGMMTAIAEMYAEKCPEVANFLLRMRHHLYDAAWVMHYTLHDDVDSDRKGVSP